MEDARSRTQSAVQMLEQRMTGTLDSIDRLLTLYLLGDHGYEPPIICEARGLQSVTVLAGLTIDWNVVFDT